VKIEVVYARSMDQRSVVLDLPEGASAQTAIGKSGLLDVFPQIAASAIGIWGRAARLSDSLREGDRVEIYRPLEADPKQARLRRAAQGSRKSR
jgi:uncharacterized protein